MNETFEQWMERVDETVVALAGLSVYDLVDIDFWSLYEDEATPVRAAKKALKASGW